MTVLTWLLLAGIAITSSFSLGYGIPDAVQEIRIISEDARTVYAVLKVEDGNLVPAAQSFDPTRQDKRSWERERIPSNQPVRDDDGWGFTLPDRPARPDNMPRRDDDGWGFTMDNRESNDGFFAEPRRSEVYGSSREERVRILIFSDGRPHSFAGLMDSDGEHYWVLWRNQPIELEEFLREVWSNL